VKGENTDLLPFTLHLAPVKATSEIFCAFALQKNKINIQVKTENTTFAPIVLFLKSISNYIWQK
jgi:hypothetical protein